MSEDASSVPFKATLKGQGQTDPWTTVEGISEHDFRQNLAVLTDLDEADVEAMSTPEIIAKAAADYVSALNAQPGISSQRDNKAAQPAASPSPAAGGNRPALSTSLELESDGNYWISLPYQSNAALGARQREHAKALGARFKKDDVPPSVPRKNGKAERMWCVHTRFVSEENVAELLRLHETGFAEIK